MNKFTAKVKFKREEDAKNLTRAFFKEFNPESRLEIRGKEAIMEIAFEQPPMGIIEAITNGEEVELNYGEEKEKWQREEEPEPNPQKEPKQLTEQEAAGKADEKEAKKSQEKLTVAQLNAKLLEIEKQAKSFQHFVELVEEYFGMQERKIFFDHLVTASVAIKKNNEKIRWKKIYEFFNTHYEYASKDFNWCSKKISQKAEVSVLQFLKMIANSELLNFRQKQEITEVKMDCMPECEELKKALESIDKTWPVEQKVQTVLQAMNLSSMPKEVQEQLVKIATVAMEKEKITEAIYAECGIPEQEAPIIRMHFYKFIEQFIKDHGGDKKVTVSTFLKALQKCIM